MNYAFYISGKSGRFKKFLQNTKNDFSDIKLIVSDYEIDSELNNLFENYNIEYRIFVYSEQGANNKERNLNFSNNILKEFLSHNIDYCFSFGSHILAGELLEKYKNRIINFHPSVLPMFPGLKSIDQAVLHGNTLLIGNTAHFIDSGVDTGPVIMQSVIPTKAFTDTNDYDIVLDLQIEMLEKIIHILNNDRLKIIDGKAIINGADYHKSAVFPNIAI